MVLFQSLNIKFTRRRSVVSATQYENRRRMASLRGPVIWITAKDAERRAPSKTNRKRPCERLPNHMFSFAGVGGTSRVELDCHTCSRAWDVADRFLHCCMVVEQEELLEIFWRLVYKLVFTQCALFPQPFLLPMGVTGYSRDTAGKGKPLLSGNKIKLTFPERNCLWYH